MSSSKPCRASRTSLNPEASIGGSDVRASDPRARVVILGSVNVDLVARARRLPRPGETVMGSGFSESHGGKGANQAVAAARAGAEVVLCAAVGTDGSGDRAISDLLNEGVNCDRVARVGEPTGLAIVLVDDEGENEIVVVEGANARASGVGVAWRRGDVAAAVLEVPIGEVRGFFREARSSGATTLLNAAPADPRAGPLVSLSDVVCVNERELETLGGLVGGVTFVVTRGANGVVVFDGDGEFEVGAHPVSAFDTVGAGDTICGFLAAGLAAGLPVRAAVVRANAAAALSVTRSGARSSPTAAEVDEFLGSLR